MPELCGFCNENEKGAPDERTQEKIIYFTHIAKNLVVQEKPTAFHNEVGVITLTKLENPPAFPNEGGKDHIADLCTET